MSRPANQHNLIGSDRVHPRFDHSIPDEGAHAGNREHYGFLKALGLQIIQQLARMTDEGYEMIRRDIPPSLSRSGINKDIKLFLILPRETPVEIDGKGLCIYLSRCQMRNSSWEVLAYSCPVE